MSRAHRAAAAVLVAGALGTVTATPAAGANSIVSVDVGQPKAEIATTVTARTIVDQTGLALYLRYRPTGGPACAPTAATDPGTALSGFYGRSVSVGDTSGTAVNTFSAGTFQLCGWLSPTAASSAVVATSTSTFTVASPVGAINAVAIPANIAPGSSFLVQVSGQSEVPRRLYTAYRPASEPACSASPSLEQPSPSSDSQGPSNQASVLGAFTQPIQLTITKPGRYRFCSWIASDRSDLAPLGVNESQIIVVAPRPKITRAAVSGRRLSARINISGPGRLRVLLIGKGRTIVLTNRQVSSARTITLSYRRPNAVARGVYTLRANLQTSTGAVAVTRVKVRLR